MRILVVLSSPNASGLTAACAQAARQGVVDGGGRVRVVNLNDLDIARCAVHNGGWGSCRSEHRCQLEDDFGTVHDTVREAEGFVFVTPVYFGEPSEPMKAFFDRLRRCEATREDMTNGKESLVGRPSVCIAAAGGSGAGAVSCLATMERVIRQIGAGVYDTLPVTQRTSDYQLETVHDAVAAMTSASRTGTRSETRKRSSASTRKRRGRSRR